MPLTTPKLPEMWLLPRLETPMARLSPRRPEHSAISYCCNIARLRGAFDTMDEAADMIGDLLPIGPPRRWQQMARGLGVWKQREGLSPSLAGQLSDGMDSLPSGVARARPDAGAIFTSLVESSPSIALEGLKKSIRARRLAQAGREEREKEARERWRL